MTVLSPEDFNVKVEVAKLNVEASRLHGEIENLIETKRDFFKKREEEWLVELVKIQSNNQKTLKSIKNYEEQISDISKLFNESFKQIRSVSDSLARLFDAQNDIWEHKLKEIKKNSEEIKKESKIVDEKRLDLQKNKVMVEQQVKDLKKTQDKIGSQSASLKLAYDEIIKNV